MKKSNNTLEQKRHYQAKILHKRCMFTIIALTFVREQLNTKIEKRNCCVNKCKTKKERQTTKKTQEHRNIAPLSLQLRSYKKGSNLIALFIRPLVTNCRLSRSAAHNSKCYSN